MTASYRSHRCFGSLALSLVAVVALVPPLAMVAGCSAAQSSDLGTNEIQAYLRVEVVDALPQTRYVAIFSQDLTTDVRLENGDQILVTTDKEANLMLPLGDLSVYAVNIPQIDRTVATFSLVRPNGTPAPNSKIAIPPSLALTAPAAMADVPFAAGAGKVTVAWSNKVDGSRVRIHTNPCDGTATTGGEEVPDTGSYDLATKDMTIGTPTAAQCIQLTIFRRIVGTPDPAYKSGSTLESSRSQQLKVNLTP